MVNLYDKEGLNAGAGLKRALRVVRITVSIAVSDCRQGRGGAAVVAAGLDDEF